MARLQSGEGLMMTTIHQRDSHVARPPTHCVWVANTVIKIQVYRGGWIGLDSNPHTHPLPTEKAVGTRNLHRIPILTKPAKPSTIPKSKMVMSHF